MPIIQLQTFIQSDIESCFDLARLPSFHLESNKYTQEKVIQGDPNKLLTLNDTITWEAVHFHVRQRLQVKIIEYDRPFSFTDEILSGAFKSMRHFHRFKSAEGGTIMEDEFTFKSPLGFVGRAVDVFILKKYMTNFLKERNVALKQNLEMAR